MAEAEKSEGGKPRDFFVGVVDLFAVFLPGAALALFLQRTLSENELLKQLLNGLPEGAAKWAIFLVASYILGHFIFAVGSFFLDDLYDVSYKKWFGERKGVPALKTEVIKYLLSWTRNGVNEQNKPLPALPKELIDDEVFDLATSFVRVQSGAAAVEIDRVEADSKFFRSLIILQLVSWPLLVSDKGLCWWIYYATLVALLLVTKIRRIKWFANVLGQNRFGK
jgi:hypothetical protein